MHGAMADRLVKRDADKGRDGFNSWVAENHLKGTGALHPLTKPPQGWQPRPKGCKHEGHMTPPETVKASVKERSMLRGAGAPSHRGAC